MPSTDVQRQCLGYHLVALSLSHTVPCRRDTPVQFKGYWNVIHVAKLRVSPSYHFKILNNYAYTSIFSANSAGRFNSSGRNYYGEQKVENNLKDLYARLS